MARSVIKSIWCKPLVCSECVDPTHMIPFSMAIEVTVAVFPPAMHSIVPVPRDHDPSNRIHSGQSGSVMS